MAQINWMGPFTAIGMRTAAPDGAIVINTCSDNDTAKTGDATRWSWSNPTNRAQRAQHKNDADTSAVSLECLWQGTKIQEGQTQPDARTLEGEWRRGKGKRPKGAWNGAGRALITSPGEARREIYLPAFVAQLHNQLLHNDAARESLHAAVRATRNGTKVVMRDFDTGRGIDRNGPMSHAWVMAVILNNQDEQFGRIDAETAARIKEIQRIAQDCG